MFYLLKHCRIMLLFILHIKNNWLHNYFRDGKKIACQSFYAHTQSYIVALHKISMIGGNKIIINKHELPVSRNVKE